MQQYSVLMSVYEKENAEFLRQSIQSMLSQTRPPCDFVLVCDGPLTNALDDVIAEFESKNGEVFRIVRLETNSGLGTALNTGLKHCRNEIVARMDSDDIAFADRCERQITAFEINQCDIVSGSVLEFESDISTITAEKQLPETNEEILRYARRRNPFNHPCVMFKKSVVQCAGGYQHFYLLEDYYLWLRMLENGAKGYNIQEPILYMRAGAGMYNRRGGLKYLVEFCRFRWWMKQQNIIGWIEFFLTVGVQAIVCMIPNRLRRFIYIRLLRSNKKFC